MAFSSTFVRSRRRGVDSLLVQTLLTAGVGVGAVLCIGAYLHLSSQKGLASTSTEVRPVEEDGVQVLIPIQPIEIGTPLDPTMFKKERRPIGTVSGDAVRDIEEVKGFFAKGLLINDQPFSRAYLTTLQPTNVLTASIPLGYRAVAIKTDLTSSVEGWARAGARVDVLWAFEHLGQKKIACVAQNAKILSANRQAEGSPDPNSPQGKDKKAQEEAIPQSATLLLNTKDSLRVQLASRQGKLSLALRGTVDPGKTSPCTVMSYGEVFSLPQGPIAPKVAKYQCVTVKDRKDSSKSEKKCWDEFGRTVKL